MKMDTVDVSTVLPEFIGRDNAESQQSLSWHERISQSSINPDRYLIEYLFNEKVYIMFLVDSETHIVFYAHSEPILQETLTSLSNGAVLKLWLQLNKKYCLHASGVRIDDEVVLFIGPKGAGKSTTAAYFNSKGCPIWCDDYCTLEQRDKLFYAFPGETQVKLKSDTIQGLSIVMDHLQPLYAPYPEFSDVPVDTFKSYYRNPSGTSIERSPVKIKAIILLHRRSTDNKVLIKPAHKMESLKVIMGEIMLRDIVTKEYMGYYFGETKKMLDIVPIYTAQAADDLAQINRLFESILDQVSHGKS